MITVVGSVNLDLIARVERLPRPGETVPGDTFSTAPGGKGANQALAARRAGAEVRLIGAVGKDSFAAEALQCLREGGVDLSGLRETHAATGTAMIMVAPDGENVIAVIAGANGSLLPADMRAAGFSRGEVVLLQNEVPVATVRAALEEARQAGAKTLLNTAPAIDEAAELLALADMVIANETEFDHHCGLLELEGARREDRMAAFARQSGRPVVVTLGAEGAVAATPDGGLLRVAAPEIVPVDTVGAGDTFCGYLAAALEAELELEEALVRATVAGSLACLKHGAQPSIPFAADVDEAMGG